MRFVSFWELHSDRSTYQLQRCAFVCPEVATLLDPGSFMQRFTRPGADATQLAALAGVFCAANGQEDRGAKPMEARLWLQECCSLACACQVIASSSASWRG